MLIHLQDGLAVFGCHQYLGCQDLASHEPNFRYILLVINELYSNANYLQGVMHIVGFFAILITLGVMAPKHTADFVFVEVTNTSGWSNDGVSWLVGLLSTVYPFLGYDAACHLAEGLFSYLTFMLEQTTDRILKKCHIQNATFHMPCSGLLSPTDSWVSHSRSCFSSPSETSMQSSHLPPASHSCNSSSTSPDPLLELQFSLSSCPSLPSLQMLL